MYVDAAEILKELGPDELPERLMKPSVASAGYSPWVPPFHFDTVAVFDSKGHRVCDMRGWGFLTGGGACNLPEDEAAKIQDAMGEKIAALMNKDARL